MTATQTRKFEGMNLKIKRPAIAATRVSNCKAGSKNDPVFIFQHYVYNMNYEEGSRANKKAD